MSTPRANSPAFLHFAPIAKSDAEQRIVMGVATSAIPDDEGGKWQGQRYSGDVIDAEAMRAALDDYMAWANIREMHESRAAGQALDVHVGDDGRTYLVAHIADDGAWKKVQEGIYKGFSIGGRALKAVLETLPDGRTVRRILKLLLTEISLVDRPRNPEAAILISKRGGTMSDDAPEERADDAGDALTQLAALGDLAKAGGDPSKVISQIQALRNEAELGGDLEAAENYTAAISLLLIAAGKADAPDAAEAEEDIADDASQDAEATTTDNPDTTTDDSAPPVIAQAAAAPLQKVGKKIAGSRMAILKSALMSYAKALADAGDEDAVKMLKAVGPSTSAGNDATLKAIGADIRKSMDEPFGAIANAVLSLNSKIEALAADILLIKAQPSLGGPVARFAGQPITKRLGTETPPPATPPVDHSATIARLRRLATLEVNPVTKQQYLDQLKQLGA